MHIIYDFLVDIAWTAFSKQANLVSYPLLFQMTCIRVLEILPVVFGKVCPLLAEHSGYSGTTTQNVFDFKWLHDLMDWGKSQLKVVIVYWKRTITCLLNLLKDLCSGTSLLNVSSIENLISSGELFI